MELICYKWNYFQVTVQIEQLNTYWQGCRWGMGEVGGLAVGGGFAAKVRMGKGGQGRTIGVGGGAMHAGKDLIY